MLFEERIYYARPLKCQCFLWRSRQLKKYMDLYEIMLLWVTPLWKFVVRIRPTIFGLLRGQVASGALGARGKVPSYPQPFRRACSYAYETKILRSKRRSSFTSRFRGFYSSLYIYRHPTFGMLSQIQPEVEKVSEPGNLDFLGDLCIFAEIFRHFFDVW